MGKRREIKNKIKFYKEELATQQSSGIASKHSLIKSKNALTYWSRRHRSYKSERNPDEFTSIPYKVYLGIDIIKSTNELILSDPIITDGPDYASEHDLHLAILSRDVTTFNFLINELPKDKCNRACIALVGLPVDYRCLKYINSNYSPLTLAIVTGHYEMVSKILQKLKHDGVCENLEHNNKATKYKTTDPSALIQATNKSAKAIQLLLTYAVDYYVNSATEIFKQALINLNNRRKRDSRFNSVLNAMLKYANDASLRKYLREVDFHGYAIDLILSKVNDPKLFVETYKKEFLYLNDARESHYVNLLYHLADTVVPSLTNLRCLSTRLPWIAARNMWVDHGRSKEETTQNLRHILSSAQENSNLKVLDLDGFIFNTDVVNELVRLLKNAESIKEITLRDITFAKQSDILALGRAILGVNSLKTLKIVRCNADLFTCITNPNIIRFDYGGPTSLAVVKQAVEFIKPHAPLESLVLNLQGTNVNEHSSITKLIIGTLKHNKSLKKLNVYSRFSDLNAIKDFLYCNHTVTDLLLSQHFVFVSSVLLQKLYVTNQKLAKINNPTIYRNTLLLGKPGIKPYIPSLVDLSAYVVSRITNLLSPQVAKQWIEEIVPNHLHHKVIRSNFKPSEWCIISETFKSEDGFKSSLQPASAYTSFQNTKLSKFVLINESKSVVTNIYPEICVFIKRLRDSILEVTAKVPRPQATISYQQWLQQGPAALEAALNSSENVNDDMVVEPAASNSQARLAYAPGFWYKAGPEKRSLNQNNNAATAKRAKLGPSS